MVHVGALTWQRRSLPPDMKIKKSWDWEMWRGGVTCCRAESRSEASFPSPPPEDVASLAEGSRGGYGARPGPEMDVTCRGYVSFVLWECVCACAREDKSVCAYGGVVKNTFGS